MAQTESPHGTQLAIDCAECHNSSGWLIDHNSISFDHDDTDYELIGIHDQIDCKQCHTTLVFEEVPNQCASCHTDIHNQTVGDDCMRCHTPQSWLVDEIPELHEQNGFPLVGAHAALTCVECHGTDTNLRFNRIGNECVNCHLADFQATTNPNHIEADFSTQCDECHNPFGFSWDTEIVNHDFFPLVMGHEIQDCTQCHLTDNFSDASPDCISCHEADFQATTNPNHVSAGFSTDCTECHNLEPGWFPFDFQEHDNAFFPIYSGSHQGTWVACTDCHTDLSNYSIFTCVTCHELGETTEQHENVPTFTYVSNACFQCHPNGEE